MDNKTFQYSYSADEQKEILKIKEKYTESQNTEKTGYARLKEIDSSVTKKATTTTLTLGIIGALIMGLGMSLIMTELGQILNIEHNFIIGVVIGIIGLGMVIISYPVYSLILKKERAKVASEIIAISDELLK